MIQTPKPSNRTRNQDADVQKMTDAIVSALEEAKGININILDVRKLTDVTDFMVIVTGSSDRHVKTLSERVLEFMNKENFSPLGVEGEDSKNWVLVDYVDVIVHIMREKTRKHYDLEGLWDDSLSQEGSPLQETQIS